MIKLHHLENSRSQRILWLLEELSVEYEIVHYKRDPKTMLAPASLRAIHPLGKSPVITDGDRVVAESGAIIEYLIDRYGQGRLRPADGTPELDDYRYWLHFAEGTLMPYLVMKLVFTKVETGPMPFFIRPIARRISKEVGKRFIDSNLHQIMEFLEAYLSKHTWFAGDSVTGADVQMSFAMEALVSRAAQIQPYPNIRGYVQRMRALPTYQRALEQGGPLVLL
ncbi:MAG: glutathione S-transferase [Pseudomonadales bacterium]|nr:glutathione S-transferase [Pseudomonadales bacterium]